MRGSMSGVKALGLVGKRYSGVSMCRTLIETIATTKDLPSYIIDPKTVFLLPPSNFSTMPRGVADFCKSQHFRKFVAANDTCSTT